MAEDGNKETWDCFVSFNETQRLMRKKVISRVRKLLTMNDLFFLKLGI